MFGVELTWLGWVYIVLSVLGILINVLGGMSGRSSTPSEPEVRIFVGMLSVLFVIGFFTVGFTH